MSENQIKVTATTNKPLRVNVTAPDTQGNVTLSPDSSAYNAGLAEQWAISDKLVMGKDYSSKYYANQAKENALSVENFAEDVSSIYNSFTEISDQAINELNITRDEAIANIETSRVEAVDSINSTKTTILSDIEFVADGEKKEIEDLIDNGKDELKEAIGDVKVLTTLEIGDIGIAPLGIDETKGKRRYLNGQVIIQEQYVQFANKVKSAVALYPSLACTESEWQTTATMTVGGQVGKFVVDDEAGTIRLPKIIMPIQGLTDLSKLAEIVEAGLPNITGQVSKLKGKEAIGYENSALTIERGGEGTYGGSGTSWQNTAIYFDASKSNPTYGKSNTVQQEQIQYPYFIQVATGAEIEDNIVNEIELNNPFSLLDYKYSEYELNNLSWLRSNGQYNSKAVYPAVYDLLLKIYNGTETKAGVSVKLSTDTSATDYDFRINTADETFMLPTKVKQKFFAGEDVPVVGNGKVVRWTDISTKVTLNMTTRRAENAQFVVFGEGGNNLNNVNHQVALASSNSGIIAKVSQTEVTDLYLYFYVGETVQNANLINAGRIEETLAKKVDIQQATIASFPSNKYIDLTLGASGTHYTAPANGWIVLSKKTTASNQYVSLGIDSSIRWITHIPSSGNSASTSLPVRKGQDFYCSYNAGGTLDFFRFIYAQGEV